MKSFLIDLDGVLYVGKKPMEGAKECLERLDELGYDYRFVSNSTRRCRSSMAKRLEGFGYQVQPRQIFTPPPAAIQRIMRSKKNRCFLLSTGDVHLEFENAGISLANEDVDFVIVGDAGQNFTFDRLNLALRLILNGAKILALEQDRYWGRRQTARCYPLGPSWPLWNMPRERRPS